MDAALNKTLAAHGVIPVIAIDDPEQAEPLAQALVSGGLPVAEITFRTQAAATVIRKLRDRRPDLLVGAGTVLTVDQLLAARDAGARFALAPGFSPEVVQTAQEIGLPFFPGVMTPTDIQAALAAGAQVMKFFPAQPAGGIPMLESLSAPFSASGVRFIPTGGVKLDNLGAWLSVKSVLAVGGTWIATREMIRSNAWEAIRRNAAAVRELTVRRGAAGIES